jgi:hypothetical protein
MAASLCCIGIAAAVWFLGAPRVLAPVTDFLGTARRAEAVVQGSVPGYAVYPLRVTYTPEGGNEALTVQINDRGRVFRLKMGAQMQILYSPDDPAKVLDASALALYYPMVILALFCIPIAGFGVLFAVLAILGRESLVDLSSGAEIGGEAFARGWIAGIAGTIVFVLALILKSAFDIPRAVHTGPFIFLSFCSVFMVVMAVFIGSAAFAKARKG